MCAVWNFVCIFDINIEASLIFFARLLLICAPREYSLWGGKPHSFGNINVPSSQGLCKRVQSKFICFCKRAQPRLAKSNATLISRCRCKKTEVNFVFFARLLVIRHK